MTDPIPTDPSAAFRGANLLAARRVKDANRRVWQQVAEKAEQGSEYKSKLLANPKEVIHKEMLELFDEDADVVEAVDVEAIADRAKEKYSQAVPGVNEAAVEQLVFGTIDDLRKAFTKSILLTQVLFYAGLAIAVIGFLVAVFTDGGQAIAGGILGSTGVLGSIVSSAVTGATRRVHDAASNLVQLQMAFLTYYKQLWLLGAQGSQQDMLEATKALRMGTYELMRAVRDTDGTPKPDDTPDGKPDGDALRPGVGS